MTLGWPSGSIWGTWTDFMNSTSQSAYYFTVECILCAYFNLLTKQYRKLAITYDIQGLQGCWVFKIGKYKTGVINDPLCQTHSHASNEHCFLLFCFSKFETWGRTDGQHVRKQWSLPAVTLGWPSGSIIVHRNNMKPF